jgi:23S rRNA (pseudouridine1915-N3)-methyltransferase
MKFTFLWAGKTRNGHLLALQQDYLARLSRFVQCSVVEVRESGSPNAKNEEAKRIIGKLPAGAFICILDEKGTQESSAKLADRLRDWQDRALREVVFVIGGADGLSSAVAEKADHTLSLSFMTFTHEMARVVLLEQLYRAFTILRGFPYQR